MNQQLIIQVSAGVLFFIAIIGLAAIILASVYDLRAISRRRHLAIVVRRLRRPHQPHVTILVHNTAGNSKIEACLRSISQSRYRKYDVVVVDCDVSHLARQTVRNFKNKHPQTPLYYYGKRKVSSRVDGLRAGYQKSQKGELIFVLDADSTVSPMLVKECVARFVASDALQALQLNERGGEVGSIAQLSRRLLQLSRQLVRKSASLLAFHTLTVGTSNVLYRRARFVGKAARHVTPARYEAVIVVAATSHAAVRRWLLLDPRAGRSWVSVGRALLLLGAVFFITYFLYVAMTLQSSSLLILSWLISVIWLLAAVWSDEATNRREKLILAFCIPPFYFLIYSQLIVIGIMNAIGFVTSPLRHFQSFHQVDDRLAERPL